MTVSPNTLVGDVVSIDIKVDGKALDDAIFVTEIEVETAVNRLPHARICIADGSAREEVFAASNSGDFLPGKRIEVALGYNAKTQPVFAGVIRSHSVRMGADGETALELGCADPALVLTLARNARLFTEMSDADCVTNILQDAKLKATVKMDGAKAEHSVQYAAKDWDYILARAEANGCVIRVQDGAVSVAPPAFETPVLSLRVGEAVSVMELEIDAAQQVPEVTAHSWDPTKQVMADGQGVAPRITLGGTPDGTALASAIAQPGEVLRTDATLAPKALEGWAAGRLLKSRLARLKGRVAFPGYAQVSVGDQVTLGGLGKTFDGDAWVSGVRHRVTSGRWDTEVRLGLDRRAFTDAKRDVSAAPAAGLAPGVAGLHIAKVLQIHDDPQGQDRIKVALPLVAGGEAGHWIRVATPFAGAGAGIRFLPEVDDEVVLGFLQGDPNAAVMLGALHSGNRAAPTPADEKNTVKEIATTAGLKVQFDEEKKTLTLATPGGHMVTLDDEAKAVKITDSTGNAVTLDDKGITLDAKGDLALAASGAVTVKGQSVTGEAKTDLSLKGTNVTVEAQAALTAKGTAKAEFSASGPVTVRGLPINLN
ncbi:MAG: type VI secretion system tip protein VgrG [Pseudomonadota bacterium]